MLRPALAYRVRAFLLLPSGLSLLLATPALAQDPSASSRSEPAQSLQAPGIENFFKLSPRLYSGGQPEGDAAFQALRDRGVRTIITVDGALPDLETAHRHGIRYVHIPVGYDGIQKTEALDIVRAASTLPGPVYVHCHHGLHRGPTAAALCAIAIEDWNADQALNWMNQVGTSRDYAGLYATIQNFDRPDLRSLARETRPLPERVEVPDLIESMVQVDSTFERLKAIQAASFQTPADQPDLDPAHEALMLVEHYRELARLKEAQAKGDAFLTLIETSKKHALELQERIKAVQAAALESRAQALERASAAFKTASSDCKRCHSLHRDRPETPAPVPAP